MGNANAEAPSTDRPSQKTFIHSVNDLDKSILQLKWRVALLEVVGFQSLAQGHFHGT